MKVRTLLSWRSRRGIERFWRSTSVGFVVVSMVVMVSCGTRVSRSAVVAALGQRLSTQTGNSNSNGSSLAGSDSGTASNDAAGSAGSGNSTGGPAGGAGGGAGSTGGPAAQSSATAGAGSTAGSAGAAKSGNASTQAAGCSGPATGTPVVLGNIGEYSGAPGVVLAPGAPMVQVVVKWINAHCGLNGHPVKLVQADDSSDPSRYQALAQQMVQVNHAIAFLSNFLPISAPGASAYLAQQGVPLVGGDGTNAAWFTNPNMFFAGTTFKYVAIGAARYAVQLGKPKVGFLYCGEASPCRDAYNAVRTPQAQSQFGYQLVYSAQVSLTQPDFTSECLAAKSAGVQALQLGMDANSVSRVARSCSQQGYRPQYITASLAVINDIASDPNVDGMVASVATFPWMANDLPAEHDYWSAIQQYDPGLPLSAAGSEAWVSGLLLKAATANLPANPTSADILQGLWTIKGNDFGGLSPPVTFNRGQPAAEAPCYYAIRVQGLKWIAPSGSKPQC